jgi:hypothetical protein
MSPDPNAEAAGRTVRKVLENVFAEIRHARRYVLDDQAALQIARSSPTP